jgi:hypothetical protein
MRYDCSGRGLPLISRPVGKNFLNRVSCAFGIQGRITLRPNRGGVMQIVAAVYRLAVAFWVGGVAIFTFVLTPIIFKAYSRDEAGRIVGFLFPAYFRWGVACGLAGAACLLILRGRHFVPSLVIILVMLSLSAFGAFYIEPRAAALKRQIPSFVTTPKDHPLRREFSKLHAISAACNLAVFGGGVALVVLL